MSFWDVFWLILLSFLLITYLVVLFHVVVDLLQDPTTGGLTKALWTVALVLLPFLTAVVYILSRGDAMADRAAAGTDAARAQRTEHPQGNGGGRTSPADQIARGKDLLDSGAISEPEFASLKARALAP